LSPIEPAPPTRHHQLSVCCTALSAGNPCSCLSLLHRTSRYFFASKLPQWEVYDTAEWLQKRLYYNVMILRMYAIDSIAILYLILMMMRTLNNIGSMVDAD